MCNISNWPDGQRECHGVLYFSEKCIKTVKMGQKLVKMAFFARFRLFFENDPTDFDVQYIKWSGLIPTKIWTTLFSENIHKKGQNQVKNGIFSCFLPVSDYVSEISSPKATKSRAVRPFTTNYVLFSKKIHKKGQKGQKQVTNGIFSCFCPFQTISRKVIVGFWCVIYQIDRTDNESVMGYFIFPKNA